MKSIISKDNILLQQASCSIDDAIQLTGDVLVSKGYAHLEYVNAMLERNKVSSVYLGNGVALPHGITGSQKYIIKSGISLLQFPNGISLPDQNDKAYIFVGLALIGNDHIDYLEKIALTCIEIENVEKLKKAQDPDEIIKIFDF